MVNDDPVFAFVKGRLEDGAGIGTASLERLLRAARRRSGRSRWSHPVARLLAASLAMAVGGWLVLSVSPGRRQAAEVENVLSLVRMADGCEEPVCESLAENLLAFQDAPVADMDD